MEPFLDPETGSSASPGPDRRARPLQDPSADPLPPILRYVDLEIECEAQGDLAIRRFVTNTIRGGFGYRLKELICVSPARECPACLLRPSCIYTRTFDTKYTRLPGDAKIDPPPPYVFTFDFSEGRLEIRAGTRFRFGLRVFGDVCGYLPYFLVALFQLGESGLGKDLTRFRIVGIDTIGPTGAREELFRWGDPIRRPRVAEVPHTLDRPSARGLVLYLRTPTRIKMEANQSSKARPNRTTDRQAPGTRPGARTTGARAERSAFVGVRDLGVAHLVHAAERRIALLQRFYDPDRTLPRLDPSQLADVRIVHRDLDWQSRSRTSTRSGPMVWDGVVGKLELAGPVAPLLRLLQAAAKTHIGSKAAFGLGSVEVYPIE